MLFFSREKAVITRILFKEQQEQRNNEQQEVEIRRKEKERKRIQAEEAIRLQKEQTERERMRKENELRAIQVCGLIFYCAGHVIRNILRYRTVTGGTRSTSSSTVQSAI